MYLIARIGNAYRATRTRNYSLSNWKSGVKELYGCVLPCEIAFAHTKAELRKIAVGKEEIVSWFYVDDSINEEK